MITHIDFYIQHDSDTEFDTKLFGRRSRGFQDLVACMLMHCSVQVSIWLGSDTDKTADRRLVWKCKPMMLLSSKLQQQCVSVTSMSRVSRILLDWMDCTWMRLLFLASRDVWNKGILLWKHVPSGSKFTRPRKRRWLKIWRNGASAAR